MGLCLVLNRSSRNTHNYRKMVREKMSRLLMCPFCKTKYNEDLPNDIDWEFGMHECSCGKQFKFYNEVKSEMYS